MPIAKLRMVVEKMIISAVLAMKNFHQALSYSLDGSIVGDISRAQETHGIRYQITMMYNQLLENNNTD